MDNFMSKLSQKISAADSIKVNFMADMAEKEQMKKQLKEYDAVLQSVRNLYLKQEENNEAFSKLVARLEEVQSKEQDYSAVIEEMKNCIGKSDEFTHRECVKVYRNVQALLEEQNQKLDASCESIKAHAEQMKAPDISDELKQIRWEAAAAAKSARSNKWLLVFAVLLSIANLACLLLTFGIF